jgi:hypothetical protein
MWLNPNDASVRQSCFSSTSPGSEEFGVIPEVRVGTIQRSQGFRRAIHAVMTACIPETQFAAIQA